MSDPSDTTFGFYVPLSEVHRNTAAHLEGGGCNLVRDSRPDQALPESQTIKVGGDRKNHIFKFDIRFPRAGPHLILYLSLLLLLSQHPSLWVDHSHLKSSRSSSKIISQHPGPQFNTILRVVIGTENIIQDGWFKLVIKGLMRIFLASSNLS